MPGWDLIIPLKKNHHLLNKLLVSNELSCSKLGGINCHAGRDPASSFYFWIALKLHIVPGFRRNDDSQHAKPCPTAEPEEMPYIFLFRACGPLSKFSPIYSRVN